MIVRRGHAITLFALAAVFGGGWATGRMTCAHTLARADIGQGAAAGSAPDPAASCTDRLAMEANANLVGQVHDYRSRLTLAEQRIKVADLERAKVLHGVPAALLPSAAEWARMARDGTLRLRLPCSRPDERGGYAVRRSQETAIGILRSPLNGDFRERMRAAGLSTEELETIEDAYGRTHRRTWDTIRSACEASAGYRSAMAAHAEGEMSDEGRIEECKDHVLDIEEPSTRAALRRVAELHAADAAIERTTNDEQRIAFALTSATATLFDEMVRALGREKATRAIDNGILCLEETLFDLNAPETEPDDDG